MSTKSIKDATDRLATMADVLAVIDAASASIAGLELRIAALEGASDGDTDSSQVPQNTSRSPADSDSDGDSAWRKS